MLNFVIGMIIGAVLRTFCVALLAANRNNRPE